MSDFEIDITVPVMPDKLPLFLVDDIVIFPGIVTPLVVKDAIQVAMVGEALGADQKLLAIALRKLAPDGQNRLNEPYDIGCAVAIVKMLRIPDGSLRLLVQGLSRIRIGERTTDKAGHPQVAIQVPEQIPGEGFRLEAISRSIRDEFGNVIDTAPYLPYEMKVALLNITEPASLADFVGANLNLRIDERQEILSELNIEIRLTKISRLVSRENQLLQLGNKIQSEVSGVIEKNQREYFLREQLKAIRKELGEDEEGAGSRELRTKLDQLKAPDPVRVVARREVERLERISPSSAEYTVARTYLDWIFDLPWLVSSEDCIDIAESCDILERDHYGLKDVKERILEYLAVRKLKGTGRGSIVCFVGPPGVGKTSIGKSIAAAMGRKFVRMSLGGLRDEAEVRGHRRTYIGALPGRIIQNLRRAGTNNPVFMLDEIDKLGSDFHGDPSSAMLEVLDPEQNFSFQDNYLELDFDLSKVMFITTANYLETIPAPLRDRMEVIKLPGYVTPEKVEIARKYLAPRQIEENGLKPRQIKFSDAAIEQIIVDYTREAGVRTLERSIGKVCRKAAVQYASGEKKSFSITPRNLQNFLGSPRVSPDLHYQTPQVGVANGLAWTPVGGVMLFIEVIETPGNGKIKITGQLGDVMKESAEIAMSIMKVNAEKWKLPEDYFTKRDFHIHIPEGATPKDGPSAGVTLVTALASLLTGRPSRTDVAMTGEITLLGRVLPIGGLREKSVAAVRGHMKTIICPATNKGDMDDIPEIVKEKVEFKFVDKIEEVLKLALLPKVK